MKPRILFVLVLVAAVVGGLAWRMQQPTAAESKKTASTPKASAPAFPSGLAATAPTSNRAQPGASGNSSMPIGTAANPRTLAQPHNVVVQPPVNATIGSPLPGKSGTPAITAQPRLAAGSAKGLNFVAGPVSGVDRVRANLQQLASQTHPPNAPAWMKDAGSLKIQLPILWLNLDVKDVANGGGLETAHSTASGQNYLYPLKDDSGTTVKITSVIVNDPAGSVLAPAIVQRLAPALDQLAQNDQVNAGSYDPVFVTMQLLAKPPNFTGDVSMLWLQSSGGDADLIYLLGTAVPPGLTAGQLYTVSDFLNILRPTAQAAQAQKATAQATAQ